MYAADTWDQNVISKTITKISIDKSTIIYATDKQDQNVTSKTKTTIYVLLIKVQ